METTTSSAKPGDEFASQMPTAKGPVLSQAGSQPQTTSANDTKAVTQEAVDRFSALAHDTVDTVADAAGRYSDVPSRALETSKAFMQDKPLAAMGIALAVGIVIGRLSSS